MTSVTLGTGCNLIFGKQCHFFEMRRGTRVLLLSVSLTLVKPVGLLYEFGQCEHCLVTCLPKQA